MVAVKSFELMGEDFQHENWVTLFKSAIEELEHTRMSGRVHDANAAIVGRIERLRQMPGLHRSEQIAIDDALRTLRFMEWLGEYYPPAEKSEVTKHALEKLRSVKPAIQRLKRLSAG